MSSLAAILNILLDIAKWIVIIQAVMSWLISFNVINIRQAFVYQIWSSLNALTEPVYRPIRQRLPQTGGLDFAPVIVLIAIIGLQIVIANNL